jgi:hypothetical protein
MYSTNGSFHSLFYKMASLSIPKILDDYYRTLPWIYTTSMKSPFTERRKTYPKISSARGISSKGSQNIFLDYMFFDRTAELKGIVTLDFFMDKAGVFWKFSNPPKYLNLKVEVSQYGSYRPGVCNRLHTNISKSVVS